MGHGDGFCPLCPGQQEINEHIFYTCQKAQQGWAAIANFYKAFPEQSTLIDAQSLIDILDGCLQKNSTSMARLFVVYHTC